MSRTKTCAPIIPADRKIRVCVDRPGDPGKVITGPNDACKELRRAADADRESFYAIQLDIQNRMIGVEEVHKGDLSAVAIHPREVFKSGMLTNAAALIVAHNHPSGDPRPSTDDLMLTRRLSEAGALMGMPVLDHVIVGDKGCHSIAESNPKLFAAADFGAPKAVRRRRAAEPSRPMPRPGASCPRPLGRRRARRRRR